jgi:hypothetical protein
MHAPEPTPEQTAETSTPADVVDITPAGRRKDIGRGKAQQLAVKLFGPRGFARRKAKTGPGNRKQVALRDENRPHVVRVIGEGRTWLDAFRAAAQTVDERKLLP